MGSDIIKRLVYLCAIAIGVAMSCLLLELSAPKVCAADLTDSYNGVTFQEIYDYANSHNIVSKNANMVISLANNGQNINGKPAFYVIYITTNSNSISLVQSGSFYKSSSRYVQNYYTVYWSGSQWTYQGVNNNLNDNIWLYKPSNSNINDVVYSATITFTFNGTDVVTPPPAYELIDNVSFYNSGTYDFNLDISTTENSVYLPALASYVTHRYTAEIEFTLSKNGTSQHITYLFPTYYTYFPFKSSGLPNDILSDDVVWYKIISRETVDSFTRTFSSIGAIPLPPVIFEGASQLEWNSDEANLFAVHNKWTLRQIFDTLSADYPTFINDLSDLFVSYHYSVYDLDVIVNGSPALALEGTLDYSGAKEEEIPQDDSNIINLTKSVDNVYNQLGGVQYMMSTLTGKSTYTFKSYETSGLPDFQNISNPEYHYDDVELDSDSMSWFSWLVEYLYLRSPIGIFLTLALGVLVCRMVLW